MQKISEVHAREILDSRGYPTIECEIKLEDFSLGRASVPSGASKGSYEALELRDNDSKRYFGKGVKKAVYNINNIISKEIINKTFNSIKEFDQSIINFDGTQNKSKFGANSILALSLSYAKAISQSSKQYLFEYLSSNNSFLIPVPMINIINGGSHADNNVDIQEFMIAPVGSSSLKEALQYGSEIFYCLKHKLIKNGFNTNVGDEGGFAPEINSSKKVIEFILDSIVEAGFKPGIDIHLALDVASTELFEKNKYHFKGEGKICTSDQIIDYLKDLIKSYPIYSIEDGLSEDDWDGWKNLTSELGQSVQLVGDDLFVTNIERLKRGIDNKIANSVLIKLNQIGTLSETLSTIDLAKANNYSCIISHRSGETEDTTIADLSVATATGQIKTGSLSRSERTAKYNQLLRIEEKLGKEAKYAGESILKR